MYIHTLKIKKPRTSSERGKKRIELYIYTYCSLGAMVYSRGASGPVYINAVLIKVQISARFQWIRAVSFADEKPDLILAPPL